MSECFFFGIGLLVLLGIFVAVLLYRCGIVNYIHQIGKKDLLVTGALVILAAFAAIYVGARETSIYYEKQTIIAKCINKFFLELANDNVLLKHIAQCVMLTLPAIVLLGLVNKHLSDRAIDFSSNLMVPILLTVGFISVYSLKWTISHAMLCLLFAALMYSVMFIYKKLSKRMYVYPILCIVSMPVCVITPRIYLEVIIYIVLCVVCALIANWCFKHTRALRSVFRFVINVCVIVGLLYIENMIFCQIA